MRLADMPAEALRAELARREQTESFVGVICIGCPYSAGAYFREPANGELPVDDDGREFVLIDGEWTCPTCAEALS